MTEWHIAQLNVGTIKYPMDDPRMDPFTSQLDAINALADAAPGFVWRLQSDEDSTSGNTVTDDPMLIANMSVWESVETLFDYVYKTVHRDVMAQRRDWFEPPSEAFQVLWWVPAGHIPTADEGLARLTLIRAKGPTPGAFNFKTTFPPAAATDEPPTDMKPEPYCVGWT